MDIIEGILEYNKKGKNVFHFFFSEEKRTRKAVLSHEELNKEYFTLRCIFQVRYHSSTFNINNPKDYHKLCYDVWEILLSYGIVTLRIMGDGMPDGYVFRD